MSPTLSKLAPASESQILNLVELGASVRRRRKEQGMRIDDAASLLGVSTGVLSRMENGNPVGSDRMMRVLHGLGLSLFVIEKSEVTKTLRMLAGTATQEP